MPCLLLQAEKEPAQQLPLTRLTPHVYDFKCQQKKDYSFLCIYGEQSLHMHKAYKYATAFFQSAGIAAHSDCACSYSTTAGFVFVYSFSNNAAGAPHNGHT